MSNPDHREQIARIIDPDAFKPKDQVHLHYWLGQPKLQEAAFAKADSILALRGEGEPVARLKVCADRMNLVLSGSWDEEQDCDWEAKTGNQRMDRLDERIVRAALSGSTPKPARVDLNTIADGKVREFVLNWFAPWGAWKTAWWEFEVSDDVEMSDANALKHVRKLLTAALSGDA